MSYFPLLVLYVQTGEEVVVYTPEEIRNGVTFKVLETNYGGVNRVAH